LESRQRGLFVATRAVDGRKGADTLMVLVRDVLRHDPLSGHLFIFFSKRRDRVRIVYWDRGIGRPNGVAVGAELVNLPAATGDESISEPSGLR